MALETGQDYYNYYSSMMPWGNQGTGTTAPGTGITQLATPGIKYPPQGGGGGQSGLGGRYGNLDLSKTKNFTKDVWSQVGPPNQMGWAPKDVKGYYNPTLGNWQTLGGKNISHLGISPDKIPGITGLASSLFGKKFETKPGDIKGTFTEGWDEGYEDIKGGLKKKIAWGKKKIKKALEFKKVQEFIQHQKEEKERKRQEKEAAEAAAQAPGGGQWVGGAPAYTHQGQGGGEYTDPHTGSRDYHDPYDPGGGEKEGGLIRKAQGGMVKDLTKDPEYRGWKKVYEANPGVGSMHEKHPTFIKFYKQHERDKKKFGGLAGLLYG